MLKEYGWDGWAPLAPEAVPTSKARGSHKPTGALNARSTKGRSVSGTTATDSAIGPKRTNEYWLTGIRHSLRLMRSADWEKKTPAFHHGAIRSLMSALDGLRRLAPDLMVMPVVREAIAMVERNRLASKADANTKGKTPGDAQAVKTADPLKKHARCEKKAAAKARIQAIKRERKNWRDAAQKCEMERQKRATAPARDRRGIEKTHIVVDHYWGSREHFAKRGWEKVR